MSSVLLALALVPVGYSFGPGVKYSYDVEFAFDGFIPVLGGMEGQASAKMGVEVVGLAPDKTAPQKVSYELKTFALFVGEDEFPYSIDKIKPFFPKSNVWFSDLGKVQKTDAPKLDIPVRLPGIDPKRFADVSFLPVEFVAANVEEGQKWTYQKTFGDSNVNYDVVVKSVSDTVIELNLGLKQTYTVLEDEAKNVVKDPKDAIAKVETTVSGTGIAVYDRQKRLFTSVAINADSTSEAVDLKSKEKTQRRLKTATKVKLREKPF